MTQYVNHRSAWLWRLWLRSGAVLLLLLCCGLSRKPVVAQVVSKDDEVVYLDAQGYIRVYDPAQTTGAPAVAWVSPSGGWVDFALGDLNGDGDIEIVAVQGKTGSGRLTVYDPVVTAGPIVANQLFNGIPWRALYDTTVVGEPYLVTTGELDASVASAEIAYATLLNTEDDDNTNDEVALILLHSTDGAGGAWSQFAQRTTSGRPWTQITVGNLDGTTPDEVTLVDKDGALEVYRLNAPTLTRLFNNESSSRSWQATTIARFFSVGLPGLAASRSSSPGFNSFIVFVYNPDDEDVFSDEHAEYFLPAPEQLFAGDINANGDDEIFFLRSVPSNITNLPRLVMRNRGRDTPPAFEQMLDADNGFGGGAAGDVDGDGRAEVVIMRNNKLRTYTQLETNANSVEFTPSVTTNGRTIHAGNLDRNGYLKTPTFGVSPATSVESTLAAGDQSASGSFVLSNVGEGGSIPYTIRSQGSPTWLRMTNTAGQTQSTFTIAFDARLLTAGVYTTTILIESSNSQVSNAPLAMSAKLTVRAGLTPRSLGVVVNAPSCGADAADISVPLEIGGPTGMTFVAKIVATAQEARSDTSGIEWPSAVSWVAAQSANSVPTTMELIFHPQALPSEMVQATLELTAADSQGTQVRRVPLILLCTQAQLYLPLVTR